MSERLINYELGKRAMHIGLPTGEALVLADLCERGRECWPTNGQLSRDIGLSERQIRKYLLRLEKRKLLSRELKREPGELKTWRLIKLDVRRINRQWRAWSNTQNPAIMPKRSTSCPTLEAKKPVIIGQKPTKVELRPEREFHQIDNSTRGASGGPKRAKRALPAGFPWDTEADLRDMNKIYYQEAVLPKATVPPATSEAGASPVAPIQSPCAQSSSEAPPEAAPADLGGVIQAGSSEPAKGKEAPIPPPPAPELQIKVDARGVPEGYMVPIEQSSEKWIIVTPDQSILPERFEAEAEAIAFALKHATEALQADGAAK